MFASLLLVLSPLALAPQHASSERAAVERAVLDYAEAYYEVRPEYVARGIHPELVKMGYLFDEEGKPANRAMDYEGFLSMVNWFVESERVPDPGPKEVVVLDLSDQTALCRLTGSWGVDYMQLAKFDGRWQTRHVVWQRAPALRPAEAISKNRAAIESAVRDYVEGIYDVQPERIERSVDPTLAKLGFWRESPADPYGSAVMTYDELFALAGEWNADGENAGPTSPKKIEVLDLMEHIACAKLTAEWGIDYMHLAKQDGVWRIVQVMWQTLPAEPTTERG